MSESRTACRRRAMASGLMLFVAATTAFAQSIAVRGRLVHTMGPAGMIRDGIVLIKDGKIAAVGPAAETTLPENTPVLQAPVVTPGLIDSRCTVGLSGIYNQRHDSDQLERSSPMQPELRALDAYNPQEPLVEWVRSFGVTTIHTGHAPGELISGQTLIVKTAGNTVDQAALVPTAAVAATLSTWSRKEADKSPGTRGKMMAMLRAELIKAGEYARKLESADPEKQPERNLRLDVLVRVLSGELPLLITANRAQDIASVLRLREEFHLRIWLDSAAESYLLIDEIKAAGIPVLIHPTMARPWGEMENMSYETAGKLRAAGIPIAFQAGYESYVPKTRVVLFEAAIASANGLSFEDALAGITIYAARILGIEQRVGSLEIGKDGDVALFDGDPFEYTTHCVGVVIDGKLVSEKTR